VSAAVLRAVLADHRWGRRLLAGLAIAVVTAFAAASAQLTGAAAAAIGRELAATPPAADLVVTPGGPDVEQRVRTVPGIEAVAAFGAAPVARLAAGGAPEPWTALRSDGGPLARYPVREGRLPAGPDEAAVSEQAAQRPDVAVGEPLDLLDAGGAPRRVVVTGVVAARGEPLDAVLVTPETATALTGADAEQLDVRIAPGASAADVGAALAAAADPDATVRPAADVRAEELQRALGGGLAGVLAALAVFGGTAVVAAVITTSCVLGVLAGRQRRTVGLLRRAGAGRGQVLRALLADAAATGVTAGLAGAALSVGLVELVRLGVRLGLGEDLPSPGVPWALLAVSAAAAALATVVAAVGPAVRLSGAAVVAPPAPRGGVVTRLPLAVVLAAGAVGLVQLRGAAPEVALALVAAAGVLAYGAAVAVGPVLFPATAALLGLPLAALATGRFALRSARRAPRRATTTVAALTLLGTLLTAVLIGLQSMTLSVEDRVAARFPAPVSVVARGDAALPDDLADRIAGDPAVGAAVPVREAVLGDGTRTTVVDPVAFPPLLDGAVDAGSLAALAPGTVALDRLEAAARRVGVGDLISPAPGVEVPVVAVYRSSGVLGPVTLHPADPTLLAGPGPVRQVLVAPAPGTDADALRSAVTAVVGPDPVAAVLALAGLRADLESAVALVRAIALGLVATTVLAGVVGVAVSLLLAQRERHREAVTLRALGLTPGQVVAAAGLENGLLGAAGALVGLGLGGAFGVLAVFALGEAAVVPVDEVLLGAGALVAVAVVAGTLPAARSARGSAVPGR
jgi:putative ABC transport system permease protein